jgi:hypothetical protein
MIAAMSFPRFVKAALYRVGIGIYPVNRRQTLPSKIPDLDCYTGPEDYSRLFRPWRSPDFLQLLRPEVRMNSMLSPQKLYTLRQMLLATLKFDGDIFEAGTCSGGSARLMLDATLAANRPKTFWLLDTFAGYQKIDAARDGAHVRIADCRGNSLNEVRNLLQPSPRPVHLVPGLIPDSLSAVTTEKLCFAHIDVNLHEPTRAATEFCLERMASGGIILFDDYNWPATYGAREAIDEIAAKWNHPVVSLPESTQAFLIRQP